MASGRAPPPETAIQDPQTNWTPRSNKDSVQNACGCRVATRHSKPAERAISYASELGEWVGGSGLRIGPWRGALGTAHPYRQRHEIWAGGGCTHKSEEMSTESKT